MGSLYRKRVITWVTASRLAPWLRLTHFAGTPEALVQRCRELIDRQTPAEERVKPAALPTGELTGAVQAEVALGMENQGEHYVWD